jgi:hypothetical protein
MEKNWKVRPNVERLLSQIASRGGRRPKLRYLGIVKNNAWLTRRTTGLNLRNLLGRGLTRMAGVWVPSGPACLKMDSRTPISVLTGHDWASTDHPDSPS